MGCGGIEQNISFFFGQLKIERRNFPHKMFEEFKLNSLNSE